MSDASACDLMRTEAFHWAGEVMAELRRLREEVQLLRQAPEPSVLSALPVPAAVSPLGDPFLGLLTEVIQDNLEAAAARTVIAYVELAVLCAGFIGSPALALALILWGWKSRNPFRILVGLVCAFFAHPSTTVYAIILLSLKKSWDGVVGALAWARTLCCRPPVLPVVQPAPVMTWAEYAGRWFPGWGTLARPAAEEAVVVEENVEVAVPPREVDDDLDSMMAAVMNVLPHRRVSSS